MSIFWEQYWAAIEPYQFRRLACRCTTGQRSAVMAARHRPEGVPGRLRRGHLRR
ncbi:hypothetical protein LC612_37935 [Nostoc sp. CHAB 5834]|nr:hypothetical protein [Nostoc sp. CHAB 5834]